MPRATEDMAKKRLNECALRFCPPFLLRECCERGGACLGGSSLFAFERRAVRSGFVHELFCAALYFGPRNYFAYRPASASVVARFNGGFEGLVHHAARHSYRLGNPKKRPCVSETSIACLRARIRRGAGIRPMTARFIRPEPHNHMFSFVCAGFVRRVVYFFDIAV